MTLKKEAEERIELRGWRKILRRARSMLPGGRLYVMVGQRKRGGGWILYPSRAQAVVGPGEPEFYRRENELGRVIISPDEDWEELKEFLISEFGIRLVCEEEP